MSCGLPRRADTVHLIFCLNGWVGKAGLIAAMFTFSRRRSACRSPMVGVNPLVARTGKPPAETGSGSFNPRCTIFDPNQQQTNPNYGKVTARQDARLLRGAVKISF